MKSQRGSQGDSGDPLAWYADQFGICDHGLVKAYCGSCASIEAEVADRRVLESENLALRSETSRLRWLLQTNGIDPRRDG